mmetsp:Transcript_50511/g.121441  ORF Transcript_50511/g.121441 Transcript_50511/m.121441 type:complete len:213 (-) Transcript_50511:76-714(-)
MHAHHEEVSVDEQREARLEKHRVIREGLRLGPEEEHTLDADESDAGDELKDHDAAAQPLVPVELPVVSVVRRGVVALLQGGVLGGRIHMMLMMLIRRSADFLGAAAAAALPDGRPRPAEDVLAHMQLPELHEDEGAVADHGGGVVYGGEQQVDTLRPIGRGHDGDDCGGERAKHEPHEAQHTLTTVKDAVAFVPAAGQPEGELGDEERKRGK